MRFRKRDERDSFYRLCTYTGLRVLLHYKRLRRRVQRYQGSLILYLEKLRSGFDSWLQRRRRQFNHSMLEPLRRDQELLNNSLNGLLAVKNGKGKEKFLAFFSALVGLFTFLGRFLSRSLNYIGPAAAFLLLLSTINYYNSQNYGIIVEYAGKELGVVESEDAYDRAEEVLQSRIIYADDSEKVVSTPSFSLTRVSDDTDFTTPEELCDELISISGEVVQTLSGLYVNDRFYGAVEDGSALYAYLDSLLMAYSTGEEGESLAFADDVVVSTGLYPVTSMVDLETLCQQIGRKRGEDRSYTVQEGDTLRNIANTARTSSIALQDLNEGLTDETLTPGQTIQVSKAVPYLPVAVTTVETYEEVVPFQVREVEDSRLAVGHFSIETEGQDGKQLVTAQVERVNGRETARVITNVVVTQPAVDEQRTVGSYAGAITTQVKDLGMTFLWPSANGYLSCGIWEYSGHTGIDVAGPAGTNIFAAESGTVQIAKHSGWNGGYGQYVVINHGNGIITLYAHCSAVYVNAGDTVRKGDVIAAVGQTGNAAGNHVHFELRKDGLFLDPVDHLENIRWTK